MAATALSYPYTAAYGITCTYKVDSSSDYSSVPNNTRFYDLTAKLPFYKDTNGVVQAIYREAPSVQSVVSAATITPTSSDDMVIVTAQAEALAIANPTGTFSNGQPFLLNLKDDGTGRAITWGDKYVGFGETLLSTTTSNKGVVISCIYNSNIDKFMVLPYQQEI